MSDPVAPPSSSSPDIDPPLSPPSSANLASQTTPVPPAAATPPPPLASPPASQATPKNNADPLPELIATPSSVPPSPSKTPPQEPPVASISPPAPPLTPTQPPEASPQPPPTSVESPAPPPPSTSQLEPLVTSPPQSSSEPNVESPSPPPPDIVSPQQSSSEPNVESPAPPPSSTSPPQSSSEPNVKSPSPPPPPTNVSPQQSSSAPPPPPTLPPQSSSEPNVESPAPPPPSTSQPEPPVTSPPQSSSEPNVESPAPPPPSTSQPEPPVTSPPQSSSEPNVESPAPPPPSTSQPEPPVKSPPQSSSEPNVESPSPPPQPTSQPEPPVTSPPQISSEPNVKSPAPPPPPTSQPSPPPQDTTPSSDVANKASTTPLPADPTPPPDSTKTSPPEKPPPQTPTTDVSPSSSPPQSPPPKSPKSHVTPPPPLQAATEPSTDVTPQPPSPPRSSTTNEITNAETPNQPDQKPTDQAEQKDPNKENTSSSSINVGTIRNMLNFLHLKKKKKEQSNQSAAKEGSNKGESLSSRGTSFRRHANENDLNNMKTKLDHMRRDLKKLHDFEENLRDSMKKLEDRVQHMIEANNQPSHKPPSRRKLDQANRDIKMLSVNIPSAHKLSLAKPSNQDSLRKRDGDRADATLPNLHLNQTFLRSSEFKEYQELYNQLDEKHKLCLLCFAVFPKHEVIKKRLMMHWWLGEGFLDSSSADHSSAHKEVEDLAEEIFKKLMHVGFIQPVYKKQRQEVHSFKMHPVVHSAVVILAKSDGFFDYDSKGNPTIDSKLCARACLLQPEVTSDNEEEQDELEKPLEKVEKLDPENLETLFNISKIILDFSLEWFSKMKKLNVLYLGRWQASPYKHHIEVESSEFLDGLKNLKRLRFLSLQGISRIFELPKLLRHLTNLRILDLRACHNLEVLPKEIGMLKRLTHLDISECYLLDRVPKEIALLTELQVLKGFVICCLDNEKACTLGQLTALANLRKLSITTNKKTFPSREDLSDLSRFQKLTNLRIVWGHDFKALHSKKARPNVEVPPTEPLQNQEAKPDMGEKEGFLNSLKKLDLESFPEKRTPIWLMPGNVKNLEKLYIKGGELEQLCPITKKDKWDKVEVLCLKFLSNLKIEWRDLQASFPELYYLEKARCPNLNVYPCDEDGIWVKSEKKKVATSI